MLIAFIVADVQHVLRVENYGQMPHSGPGFEGTAAVLAGKLVVNSAMIAATVELLEKLAAMFWIICKAGLLEHDWEFEKKSKPKSRSN